MKIPKWLTLQAEIDCLHWQLSCMLAESKKRTSPIVRMIDESSGYDKKQLETAKEIIAQIEKLKKEFYRCVPR